MITSPVKANQVLIGEDSTDNTEQIPGITRELQILKTNDAINHQIEILRQNLENLINSGYNFTDSEVLAVSQALDESINKLYRILSSIIDNT